jgi:hydrogenase nickel incorporation protein HypB
MTSRRIPVIERIMSANDELALANRKTFDDHGVHGINMMASPGAGKTTLLLKTIEALAGRRQLGVIEGDVASSVDTDKIRTVGRPAVQINTGGNCHLDANQVQQALMELPLAELDLVFIENVGNLICPVGFALGEHTRLALASVPEGDDKPLKYPSIFANVDALVITKADLLPYIPFDETEFRRLVRGLNPEIRIFEVSCVTGAGMEEWIAWLMELTEKR